MKSGQLDYDGAVAQIEQMPENKKEIIRAAFAVCKDKGNKHTFIIIYLVFKLHNFY